MTHGITYDRYADDRRAILALYKSHRGDNHTPEQALACITGGMIALVLEYDEHDAAIPDGLLVMMGEVGRLWGMAHRGEPLPEDWL